MQNRKFILNSIPQGQLRASHFTAISSKVPTPNEGEVLLRTLYVAMDAASRAWMQGETYRGGLVPGDVMGGMALAEVMVSRAPNLSRGDLVFTETGWQEFSSAPAAGLKKLPRVEPLTHLVSIFGVPGLTAYFGLLDVGKPKAGDTVVISAAAGAVGSIAGQIAKIHGCRTVGIAGGEAKCAALTEQFGFDLAVDYKAGNLASALGKACPDGINIYFDNVGGATLEACLQHMAISGSIVCCGAVSEYDASSPGLGPAGVPGQLIIKRLRMQGFLLPDYAAQWDKATAQLAEWVAAGKIVVAEDILDCFDRLPEALIGLLAGENTGKRMVKFSDVES